MKWVQPVAFVTMAVAVGAQGPATPQITVASRIVADGRRSLLVHVQQLATPTDEVRIELPGATSQTAVLMSGPAGWALERDGGWARLSGTETLGPFRLRISLFDVRELSAVRLRLRQKGRDLSDQKLAVAALADVPSVGPPVGLLAFPNVMSPGEAIEVTVLNPARTPEDGAWLIAGVPATTTAPNRLKVQLPADLPAGSPLRVTYFDVWGERLVDVLSADDVIVTPPRGAAPTPRIVACARYAFIGNSICVCGAFPESARAGLRLDGQPATILAASEHAVQLSLPVSLAPGPHTVTGDPAVGFPASDSVSLTALRLQGSIDSQALMRGQSTTMRLAVEGAAEPMRLVVTNKTPHIVAIPGSNHQEVATSGGTPNAVELRVNATGKGNFAIDYRLDAPPCPCQEPGPERVSSASAPLFVPRRVLATIAAAAPAAALATAQAVAQANGLAVMDVVPLGTAAVALAVFEIVDGVAAPAKSAALAADPRVALAQPDFVYDTSQAAGPAGPATYGLQMIGADVVQRVSRGDGVRVGIIDAGVDTGHPSLAKQIAEYADVTGTGWTPDAHGTLVAGVIASESASGTSGVAPGVQLVAIKSCVPLSSRQTAARCWSSTLARGIETAILRNVRVLNLSVGGPEDRLLARMVAAASAKGIAVVSAAGNDGPTGKPSFPAGFDEVVAVTAVDAERRLYPQATRGPFVDLAAPGVDVMSTGPGGRTQLFSGTSAATAFASGAVALLLRQRPSLTSAEITAILRDTARDLGTAGRDAEFGDGLLDVCRALLKLSPNGVTCR